MYLVIFKGNSFVQFNTNIIITKRVKQLPHGFGFLGNWINEDNSIPRKLALSETLVLCSLAIVVIVLSWRSIKWRKRCPCLGKTFVVQLESTLEATVGIMSVEFIAQDSLSHLRSSCGHKFTLHHIYFTFALGLCIKLTQKAGRKCTHTHKQCHNMRIKILARTVATSRIRPCCWLRCSSTN